MSAKSKTIPVVADIIRLMDSWAPPDLAEEWDNCGLQAGSRNWPVRKIWVALDPLERVVNAASSQEVDMVITHHPLIFKPISSVDVDTPPGRVIERALLTRTAVFAAHTNLDSAVGGINDILAQKLGIQEAQPMVPSKVPGSDRVDAVRKGDTGLGRIGRLEPPLSAARLVEKIKQVLKLETVKVAGDRGMPLTRVAVCSGGGGGLLDVFLQSDAQAYICGDLRYHDGRAAEDEGRVLIDVGHFTSEHIIVNVLTQRLQAHMERAGWPVVVEACPLEKEPFVSV